MVKNHSIHYMYIYQFSHSNRTFMCRMCLGCGCIVILILWYKFLLWLWQTRFYVMQKSSIHVKLILQAYEPKLHHILLCCCLSINCWAVEIFHECWWCKCFQAGTQRYPCTHNFQLSAAASTKQQAIYYTRASHVKSVDSIFSASHLSPRLSRKGIWCCLTTW